MSAEELQEARSELGIEPWEEGELVRIPDTVTCRNCKQQFRCEDARDLN
jgi:hypothetical protein